MTSSPELTLRDSLKKGVWKEHEQAENGAFTKAIMKGTVTRSIYRQFLSELYHIYMAIEETAEKYKDHDKFGATYFPTEMNRLEAIEKDLEFYYGPSWREKARCLTPAAKEYAARIRKVGKIDPTLLISHCYVRYIGDMSGGKQIKYKLVKHLQLPQTDEGVQFYIFNQIDNTQNFKEYYFGRMNSISVTEEQTNELVMEAKQAFEYNIWLFKNMNDFSEENLEQGREHEKPEQPSNSKSVYNYVMDWAYNLKPSS